MSTKKLVSGGLLVALIWMGQNARGEDGGLNQDTLKQMGLGGLVVMSDMEAESVRGLGFWSGGGNSHGSRASASGSSFANIDSRYGDAHSENSYSSEGKHEASGNANSHAGVRITTSHGHHGNDNNGGNGGGYGNGNGNGNNGYCGNSGGGNSHHNGGQNNGNCYGGGQGSGNWHGGGQGNGNCYGGGGGRTTTTTIKVFAGGSSYAKAH